MVLLRVVTPRRHIHRLWQTMAVRLKYTWSPNERYEIPQTVNVLVCCPRLLATESRLLPSGPRAAFTNRQRSRLPPPPKPHRLLRIRATTTVEIFVLVLHIRSYSVIYRTEYLPHQRPPTANHFIGDSRCCTHIRTGILVQNTVPDRTIPMGS